MLVEPGEQDFNLSRAENYIRDAAEQGANIVLLPECLDLGWTDPSAQQKATPVPEGATCQRFVRAAMENDIHVCAGLVERSGDRLFNSALFIDPKGELLLHHRKIHELDFAQELYSTGNRLGVVDTPFGKFGVMICADGFAPAQSISRSLAMMGAEIILSPCAWAVPQDHDNEKTPYGQIWLDNYGPVCREFGIAIVGCSNVGPITAGPWEGRRCIGSSMVIGKKGERETQLPFDEESLTILEI